MENLKDILIKNIEKIIAGETDKELIGKLQDLINMLKVGELK